MSRLLNYPSYDPALHQSDAGSHSGANKKLSAANTNSLPNQRKYDNERNSD